MDSSRAAREPATDRPAAPRLKWPYLGPPQRTLLLGAIPLLVGSFLPWLETSLLTFRGTAGPGLWTLCAGVIALAGAMLRNRTVVLLHALVGVAAGIVLPIWQVARLLGLVGWGGWVPGIGMLLILAGGVTCLVAATGLVRHGRT